MAGEGVRDFTPGVCTCSADGRRSDCCCWTKNAGTKRRLAHSRFIEADWAMDYATKRCLVIVVTLLLVPLSSSTSSSAAGGRRERAFLTTDGLPRTGLVDCNFFAASIGRRRLLQWNIKFGPFTGDGDDGGISECDDGGIK